MFLLFYSVLAISRSVSPSTESDQEAASPRIDTSPDDSEVSPWYLGLKMKKSKDQKEKEIESLWECNLLNSAMIARKKV